MLNEEKRETAQALLPWYINGTLSPAEKALVEAWLAEDDQAQAELAEWRQAALAVESQPVRSAPAGLPAHILTNIRRTNRKLQRPAARWPAWQSWGVGAVAAAAFLFLFWFLIQPGLVLEWSVSGHQPDAFRVYRVPAQGGEPVLLQEVPAQPGAYTYQYVDSRLLPGQRYLYQVEAVNSGRAVTEWVAGNSLATLPYQLALLLASLAIGYSVVFFLQQQLAYPTNQPQSLPS